ALCTALGEQVDPVPITDGAGGMIAYWDDYRGTDVDIYAQHVTHDGIIGGVVTGVDLPTPAAISLEARPDPASRELFVSFSLPASQRTRIALFDIAGREVVRRDFGTLGPGRHSIELTDVAAIASGVYVI